MEYLQQHIFPMKRNRDIDLFESLFNLYYSSLVMYATHLTEDMAAAEDIVCDVFTSVWEKKEVLYMEERKAWLFSSVRNRSLNYLAHLKVRNNYQENILEKGDISGLLTWEYYVESELRKHIEQAIRQLPPQCQKIFIMSRFNNKKVSEIAEELQISSRTVEKQISIALKKLRIELADYLTVAFIIYLLQS